MQQQGEEPCESQENSHQESQNDTSDEVVPDATPDVELEEQKNEEVQKDESMMADTTVEIDVENDTNVSVSSDPPSTRSKSSRSSKKRHSKLDKSDVDSAENGMQSEETHDNGVLETEIPDTEATPTNDVEDDAQDIIVDEQDETITLETSGELDCADYTVEFPVEDGKKEESEDIVVEEEEISISASVSYEEIDESKGKCSEASEKYSLTVSSSELHQFIPDIDSQENVQEHASISENLSVSASSWGGNIRSISARKPMRNSPHFVMHGRSSVSTERAGTDGNYSDTDCSVDTTEGSTFSSLKRKAWDVDTTFSKKQKLNGSKNSNFFSMVSSPLRMLKNKLSDRIVESFNAPCPDVANGHNENEDSEVPTDKIKKEDNEITEKSLCVVSNDVNNQNSMYRSWCSLM